MAQTHLGLVAGSIPVGETPEVSVRLFHSSAREDSAVSLQGILTVLGSVGHTVFHVACL